MAPRASQQRRTLGPQSEQFHELGVAGRKTGITLKDTGIRDEHGFEPLDALFSSPRKEDSEEESASGDDGSGEDMDITTTSGIGPAALLNGERTTRLQMPLPTTRSPVKTTLNSPAQRNRMLARSSSPLHGSGIKERPSHSSSQPTRDQQAAKRRLDFNALQAGAKALSQPTTMNGYGKHQATSNSRRPYDEEEEEDEDQDDDIGAFVEESVNMLSGGDDDDMVDLPQPDYGSPVEEEEEEEVIQTTGAAKRKPDRKPKPKESPRAAKAGRRPAHRVVESEPEEEEPDSAPSEDEEPEEIPSPPQHRGRPAKNKPPPSKQAPTQSSAADSRSKKRRTPDDDAQAEEEETSGHKSKKPRGASLPAPASKGRGRPGKKADAAPAAPAEKPKKGRRRKSSIDPNDTSQVIVPRGPPLPKSRSLMINSQRHEDSNSLLRTRSGRTSYKPLAFWRNEHVEFEQEEAVDDFAPGSRAKRFMLPSIKEVVRVDEPEPDLTSRKRRKGGKKGRGGYYDADDGIADVWEKNPGAVEGEVTVWYPEHERNPPGAEDEVEVIDRQLAISARAIKTSKVKNATFRFAKTASEGFFGAGVVDMPPGSVKNQKNSRKMFMTFFVFSGKVLVSVNESTFRISKGGMWFVPRGNYYSIENDYDQPARIFFAQGCEISVNPDAFAEPDQSVILEADGGGESQNE